MFKWLFRILLIGVLGFVGLAVFDSYRAGYFHLPDVPEGALLISYKNGFRAMVVGLEVDDQTVAERPPFFRRLNQADRNRKYLGFPAEVPSWFEGAWSTCEPATDAEREELYRSFSDDVKRSAAGARIDAICTLDVDGQKMLRGIILSVPAL